MGGGAGLTCSSNRFYFTAVKKRRHEKYVVRTLLSTPLGEIIRSSLILWAQNHPILRLRQHLGKPAVHLLDLSS